MKLSSLCFALGAARLATCAPVSKASRASLDGDPDMPPDILTVRRHVSHPPRPTMPHHERDPELHPRRKQRNPSAGYPGPRWSPEEYPGPRGDTTRHHRRWQHRAVVNDDDDSWELVEEDFIFDPPPRPYHHRHHHQQARLTRERNDMLVVLLAMAFVVVVVVMETWESVFPR